LLYLTFLVFILLHLFSPQILLLSLLYFLSSSFSSIYYTINSFYYTKYLTILLTFYLFSIFFTFYSLTLSTFISVVSFIFCSSTNFLYLIVRKSIILPNLNILVSLWIVRYGSYQGGSPQNGHRDEQTCGTTLASAYVLHHLSAM